jgi:hypothetical protein
MALPSFFALGAENLLATGCIFVKTDVPPLGRIEFAA